MRWTVTNSKELSNLFVQLGGMPHPFTVDIRKGKGRSIDANALSWKWASEIARHVGDHTPGEIHAYNKLHFGVPIRRETDEAFREVYDERIKPLTYEAKMALMAAPIDLPVTRDMKVNEMSRFMDAVREHWMAQGVRLTDPNERKYQKENGQ
jgi:hypothetical protein